MRRSTTTGAFSVGGSEKRLPTLGTAISFAQTLASRATEEKQWGIYEERTRVARVERRRDGVIVTSIIIEESP